MTETMYQKLLGARFEVLPESIRVMHSGVRKAAGRAVITRGTSLLARLICALAQLPQSGNDVPVETVFEPIANGEKWIRTFNGQSFQTALRIARTGAEPEITEAFGPFVFLLRVAVHEHGAELIPQGVKIWGLPLPRFLCPEAVGIEREREGKYRFDVTVRFPIAGDVISYTGWLEPVGMQ